MISRKYVFDQQEVFVAQGTKLPKATGLKVGDVVMATMNNWEKGIMNGSMGKIIRFAIDLEVEEAQQASLLTPIILVAFDNGEV